MHIDSLVHTGPNGKRYTRHLLRESFRQNGKVCKRTIGNVSHLSAGELAALRLALAHKEHLEELVSLKTEVVYRQGPAVGAVLLLSQLCQQVGITAALGQQKDGRLALWQVIARVLDQGSRLSATRLARTHAADRTLGLPPFDEDDLYANLDWLCAQQTPIEDRLFHWRYAHRPRPQLFLYDVTSSYLEGQDNELACFGYNRDGKRGKKQIVVGMLTDQDGWPLSVEVFAGNTQDPATVAAQIRKLAARFGGGEVTLVGDRGMLKSRQIEDLISRQFHYITAITRPQIKALLADGTLQLGLFDQELAEVVTGRGERYVLRRNPVQAARVAARRADQLATWQRKASTQNGYLEQHPRARVEVAVRKLTALARRLKLDGWAGVEADGHRLRVVLDEPERAKAAELDGCYVLKTDLTPEQASLTVVDARYRDLAQVEWLFRISKTAMLELRPIFVRLAERTRGHALVVMLAYQVSRTLAGMWARLDTTVEEGLRELDQLCAHEVSVRNAYAFTQIPRPRESVQALLEAAGFTLPATLPNSRRTAVDTKRKLQDRRK